MPQSSPSPLQILLVDDEPEILQLTKMTLTGEGMSNVLTLSDSRQVFDVLAKEPVAVMLLDLMMPNLSGSEILSRMASEHPQIPVIIMTAMDDVETAVEALKVGAFDYLVKPVDPNRLVSVVQTAFRLNSLENERSSLKEYLLNDRLMNADAFKNIITCNKKMRAIFQYAEVIAQMHQPILITGETGVGKDLMANAIHKVSGVPGEFVTVNAAGLDDFMFSDTLFGHQKGAYTGADRSREGLIQKASDGTLFLDEIGDLSQSSQVKLLRLLQSREYYPLGCDTLKSSNARIIVATNQDLTRLMAEGRFRRDLYYRLCAYQLQIPPLRERPEDLPPLLHHFVNKSALCLNRNKPAISQRVIEALGSYKFPGNVRELQAMVNDAMARDQSGVLSIDNFPCIRRQREQQKKAPANFDITPDTSASTETSEILCRMFGRFPTIDEIEEYLINAAMKLAKDRRGVAADMLGITRQALHKRLLKTSHLRSTR